MHDQASDIKVVTVIPPQTLGSVPVKSAPFDTSGFNSLAFIVNAGTIASNGGCDFSAAGTVVYDVNNPPMDYTVGMFSGSEAFHVVGYYPLDRPISFRGTLDSNAVKRAGAVLISVGETRWTATLTPYAGNGGGMYSVVAVLGNPLNKPVPLP